MPGRPPTRRRTAARRLTASLAACASAAAAGCGDGTSITSGGRVAGDTLTVYSLLPGTGSRASAAEELVLGEKLALARARGRVGRFTVNYVAAQLPAGGRRTAVADRVREVVRDPGVAVVIGDLSTRTARVTVPLLNAAGILHVSPAAGYRGFFEPVGAEDPHAPERYSPAGARSFAALSGGGEAAALARAAQGRVAVEATAGRAAQVLAEDVRAEVGRTVATAAADTVVVVAESAEDALGVVDGVLRENRRARVLLPAELWATALPQRLARRSRVRFVTRAGPPRPGFARAFRRTFGRDPGPWAQVGYDAMRGVLTAIRRAGARANSRQALADAFLAADRGRRPPFVAIRRTPDGGLASTPVR